MGQGKRPRIQGRVDLKTRGAEATVVARMDDAVDAHVVAHASPELAAALSLPVSSTQPVDIDVRARGPMDAIAVDGVIKSGPGAVSITGRANVPGQSVVATVDLRDVDARAFAAVAPVSNIDGRIEIDARAQGPLVKANAHLERGMIAGQVTPVVDVDAALDKMLVSAHVVAEEPGTRVVAEGTLDLSRAGKPAHVRVDATSSDLARLRAIEPSLAIRVAPMPVAPTGKIDKLRLRAQYSKAEPAPAETDADGDSRKRA
jgi:hypothetical protein